MPWLPSLSQLRLVLLIAGIACGCGSNGLVVQPDTISSGQPDWQSHGFLIRISNELNQPLIIKDIKLRRTGSGALELTDVLTMDCAMKPRDASNRTLVPGECASFSLWIHAGHGQFQTEIVLTTNKGETTIPVSCEWWET